MLPGRKYSAMDFAAIAWRQLPFIVTPFLVIVLGTLVYSSTLADYYQSETLIQIIPQQVPDQYVQSTVTVRTEDRINSLRQQVLSRTELERLITSLDLYTIERGRLPMQDVVELMRANTSVDPVYNVRDRRDTDAFYIRFTYRDAEMAVRVTERLGSLFIDQNARDRGALADATDDFLKTQLAEARKRLEEQEQRLEKFRQQHAGRLPSQLQFNMQAIQNAQLQLQAHTEALARDRDRRLMLERLYSDAQAELAAVIASPSVATGQAGVASATPASPQAQIAAAKAYLASLELTRKAEHPDVIRAKRVIADLESKYADLIKKEHDGGSSPPTETSGTPVSAEQRGRQERLRQMQAEIESLGRQIAFKEAEELRLRESVADYQKRIEAVPGTESEWVRLTRDYDTQQAAYKDLLSKSEQAKVAANLERRQVGEQFRILDPPRMPERPVSPDRRKISGIGAAMGLLIGLVLAAFLEFRDATFRSAADIVDVIQLPVVALIPAIETRAERRRKRVRQWSFSAAAGVGILAGGYVFWLLQLWRYVI